MSVNLASQLHCTSDLGPYFSRDDVDDNKWGFLSLCVQCIDGVLNGVSTTCQWMNHHSQYFKGKEAFGEYSRSCL